LDRTTINAWEDEQFLRAVQTIRRKKLIMTALWTEACLAFPTVDALRHGYEVYPVVDADGCTSLEAHRPALERVVQAGARLHRSERTVSGACSSTRTVRKVCEARGKMNLPE
jgi:isochorismate hydrolase